MTGFNTQLSAECISLLNLVMALSSLVQFIISVQSSRWLCVCVVCGVCVCVCVTVSVSPLSVKRLCTRTSQMKYNCANCFKPKLNILQLSAPRKKHQNTQREKDARHTPIVLKNAALAEIEKSEIEKIRQPQEKTLWWPRGLKACTHWDEFRARYSPTFKRLVTKQRAPMWVCTPTRKTPRVKASFF